MNPNTPSKVYISYDNPIESSNLNQRYVSLTENDIKKGITGRHLYFAEPVRQDYTICDTAYIGKDGKQKTWRDPNFHYLLGLERNDHPDNFSRYGYALCPNGYCLNQFPGKYVTPQQYLTNIQPPGVAPERFYKYNPAGSLIGANYTNISEYRGRRLGMEGAPFPVINQYTQINLCPDNHIFCEPSGG